MHIIQSEGLLYPTQFSSVMYEIASLSPIFDAFFFNNILSTKELFLGGLLLLIPHNKFLLVWREPLPSSCITGLQIGVGRQVFFIIT